MVRNVSMEEVGTLQYLGNSNILLLASIAVWHRRGTIACREQLGGRLGC